MTSISVQIVFIKFSYASFQFIVTYYKQHQSRSCQGRCWEDHDLNNICNCNADCDQTGPGCCRDFETYCPTNTCLMGRCFQPFNPKAECQCNRVCEVGGHDVKRCCTDFEAVCSDE